MPPGRALSRCSEMAGTGRLTVDIGPHDTLSVVILEIDIWRVANLMLKRYGDEADKESALWAEEASEEGDHNGAAVWRRVTDAVGQLANTIPPGLVH